MTHEIEWVTCVDVGIGVAARQALDVVRAREADDAIHAVRIAEPETEGVVGAETDAHAVDDRAIHRQERDARDGRPGQRRDLRPRAQPGYPPRQDGRP